MPSKQASSGRQSSGARSRAAQAAQTRANLLAVAIEVFAETDYDKVAVAEISRRADVAHGLLFHYFGNKRGLYLAAMREAAARINSAFVIPEGETVGVQLRVALRSHLEYLAEHRGLALRLVLGGRGADPEAWQVFEDAREEVLVALATAFDLDATRPALQMVGRTCAGLVDEAAARWLETGNALDVDDVVNWLVHLMAACMRSATALDSSLDLSFVADALDT